MAGRTRSRSEILEEKYRRQRERSMQRRGVTEDMMQRLGRLGGVPALLVGATGDPNARKGIKYFDEFAPAPGPSPAERRRNRARTTYLSSIEGNPSVPDYTRRARTDAGERGVLEANGGVDRGESGNYRRVAEAVRLRNRVLDAQRRGNQVATYYDMATGKTSVAPTEMTVGGKRYYSVDDALAAATRVGNREQHRRDVFRHLAGAGFSADDIDKVQKSKFIGDTIRGLYEGRRKALLDQQKRLDDWYTEGSKGFRSKADIVGDALKKRLSLAGNLPARQSDSRLNAILPAIAAGKDIGVAVAAANARSGGSYSRRGASGGAAEYSSSIVRDVASNGLKGHEAGWARGSSGGVWIGDRSGGGSPAGSAGKAVSSILAAVHGAYPGGEFQDALPNGRLRFTRDTRGQGMGLGAGFHSARETDWNNALTDVNNWASKVYGDYLVSKKGYAERQQQLAMDKLRAAEQSVINRQLKSLAWLAERGYGVPATQEVQPSQNPAPSGKPVQTASPVVAGGVEPSPGPTEEPIVGPDGVLRDPNMGEVLG